MMKKNIAVSLFIFLCAYCGAGYGAEDRRETRYYTPPAESQRVSQQQAKPILPPIVPTGPSAISPTPSPHIAAPPILPQSINTQPPRLGPGFSQPPIMPNIPSAPAQVAVPAMSFPPQPPKVPIIGNAVGKVFDIGSDKQGTPWIEVNDDLFGGTVKIKLRNLKNTPIVKEGMAMNFRDIKIGDTVNVIFTNEDEENIASVINILTEDALKMMEGEAKPELTVTPENTSQDASVNQPGKQDNVKPLTEN